MPFDVTPAGVLIETQEEIKAALYERLQLIFGGDVDEATESIIGQTSNMVSEYMALYQQKVLAGVSSFDPAAARGVLLDQRRATTGSRRRAAYGSTVVCLLTFTDDGEVLTGDRIAITSAVGLSTEWAAYDGPYTAVGLFPETLEVPFRSVDSGPIPAPAGSEWEAVAAIANLDTITNSSDAVLGKVVESDPAFRVRSQRELFARGLGPLAAINAVVSRVVGVSFCRTYHNPSTPGSDANGIPFKAFNVCLRPDPDPPTEALKQLIFDAIFSATGAGGQAYGTDCVGVSVDSEGVEHPVAFDLVEDVEMRVRVFLVTSTSEVAVTPNANAIVAAAILVKALAAHTVAGRDVLAFDYTGVVQALINAGELTGVDGVRSLISAVGDASFVTTKRAISIREIPAFSSSRIVVSQE